MDAVGCKFRVGVVQTCSDRTEDANLPMLDALIRRAARGGADLVLTPEMSTLLELSSKRLFANTSPEQDNPTLGALRSLAGELGVWLNLGSMAIRLSDEKVANRSFLISPEGGVAARYDKIHMFDADLAGGETYRESKNYAPGNTAILADLPWGRLGLTICYDLRFPGLFRSLAGAGADFITVPSAFTVPTGEAHWSVLLRARAIETGAYIFAPAQGGAHACGRVTYGHSMVVSPWGEVLAEAGVEPGVMLADIDPGQVSRARARIPSLRHDRDFTVAGPGGDQTLREAS